MEEEKRESYLKQFWNEYKGIIITVGLVTMVYRMGYIQGYKASNNAVDAAFKALCETLN